LEFRRVLFRSLDRPHRRRGRIAARSGRAFAVEGILAAGAGRLLADPAEDIHLGVGRGRRALATLRGKHGGRARQARVPGRAGHPPGRRARRTRAAPLHRTGRLGRAGTAGGGHRLHRVQGACGMKDAEMDLGNRGKHMMLRAILTLACACLLAACSSTVVRESGTPRVSTPKPGATVVVKRGDNLYRIATGNGISTLDLATWNNIRPPYTIYPGQRLRLYPSDGRSTASTSSRPSSGASAPATTASTKPAATASTTPVRSKPAASPFAWRWPTEGQLVGTYAAGNPTRQG